jgi:molecular chaperone DnaJ
VDASAAGIRDAYRVLAKRYHPDHNPGRPEMEQRFKDISQAYALLSDPDRRRDYDGKNGVKRRS